MVLHIMRGFRVWGLGFSGFGDDVETGYGFSRRFSSPVACMREPFQVLKDPVLGLRAFGHVDLTLYRLNPKPSTLNRLFLGSCRI